MDRAKDLSASFSVDDADFEEPVPTAFGQVLGKQFPQVLGAEGVQVEFGRDGTLSVIPQTGAQTTSAVGRVKLVNPAETDLVRGPDGLFRLRAGGAAPLDDTVKLMPGYLEGSNVNPVEQMVSMISLARQFEMQTKMISNAETNDRAAAQILATR